MIISGKSNRADVATPLGSGLTSSDIRFGGKERRSRSNREEHREAEKGHGMEPTGKARDGVSTPIRGMDINQLFTQVGNAREICISYFTKLEDAGFTGIEPFLSAELSAMLHKKFEPKSSSHALEIYAHLMEHVRGFEYLVRVATDYTSQKLRETVSSSNITMTITIIKEMNEQMEKMHEMVDAVSKRMTSPQTLTWFADKIPECRTDADLTALVDEYNKHDPLYVVELLITFLHRIADTHSLYYKVFELKHMIADQLLGKGQETIAPAAFNVMQRLLHLHKLSPTSPLVAPETILRLFGSSAKVPEGDREKFHKALEVAAKSFTGEQYGFVVIYKIIRSPVEHNLHLLVDYEYLQERKLLQDKTVGINDIVIRRSETIRRLVPSGSDEIVTINPMDAKMIFVIESIDGKLYRIMSHWPSSKLIQGHKALASELEVSTKVAHYNAILNDRIAANIAEPYRTLDLQTLDKDEDYFRTIRNSVKNAAMSELKERLSGRGDGEREDGEDRRERNTSGHVNEHEEKQPDRDDSSRAISARQVLTTLKSDKMIAFIIDNIAREAQLGEIKEASAAIYAECKLSYLREMERMRRFLINDINEAAEEFEEQLAVISRGSGDTAVSRTLEIVARILDKALYKNISKRSGIIAVVADKSNLMKKLIAEP